MKLFEYQHCGQLLDFENTRCERCGHVLGYLSAENGRRGRHHRRHRYLRFQRYLAEAALPRSGLHVVRHTAAKLRRDAGESVESVSQFLDHSSRAVTTTYLRRLEGQSDTGWRRVAEAIGA